MQLKGITCTLYFKTSEIVTPENVHTQDYFWQFASNSNYQKNVHLQW